ncbi:MAG: PAS domain S-box protein [Deltaproteobacteria bacterium]|nr:PAS domain S-box protein [Deltaproteobacteria bacterium]
MAIKPAGCRDRNYAGIKPCGGYMNDIEKLKKLINLWNYALSAGLTNLFGMDAPNIYLEVGRAAVERLKEEGIEFIKDTPLDTINAVYAYFVEYGYFEEAKAVKIQSEGDVYEFYERGCAAFESNCWTFYSGGRKTSFKCKFSACFCHNIFRYILSSRFGLDLKLIDSELKKETKEEFARVALAPVSAEALKGMSLIEELRKGEAELKRVVEEYRNIIDTSLDAIVAIDGSGKITVWNNTAERMFGYTKDEALGMPVTNLMQEGDREKHRKGLKRFIETEVPVFIGKTVEVLGVKKDGSISPKEMSLSSQKIDGRWWITGIIRDIAERKHHEEMLKQRADELERMNRLMVGRELKMEELKKEIQNLKFKVQGLEKGKIQD